MEEKSDADRDSHSVPLRVADVKRLQYYTAIGNEAVCALAGPLLIEQDRAWPARTDDFARREIQQVPVLMWNGLGAQIATFLYRLGLS
jgi:hypothetical protein